MNTFQISTKIICLALILSGFSYAAFGQKKKAEKKLVLAAETVRDKTVKETKSEVIYRKNTELTTKGITQNRNMSQYKQGGYFDCRGWTPKNETRGECSETKLRDFIWQSWINKERGYVRVTYNSVDATSTSHIFIEPNEKDEWMVAWRIVRQHAIPELNNLLHDILGIVSVERVENERIKGLWTIVFKNKSGGILQKIPSF